MRHADEAMYRAKRGGLGVQTFTSGRDPRHEQRMDRLEALSARLEEELELWFQPIVDTATLETSAVEGLVRWRHARRGGARAGRVPRSRRVVRSDDVASTPMS